MKIILASDGTEIFVDDADYGILNSYRWSVFKPPTASTAYATTTVHSGSKRIVVAMHRFILNPKEREPVDHKDKNGLNNQRSNIRICTVRQNHYNMKKYNRCNAEYGSPYKGVCWERKIERWKAYIKVMNHVVALGYFDNPHDAAEAYNLAAHLHYGEFAQLNVIERHVDWKTAYKNPLPISKRKTHLGRPQKIKRVA